MMEAMIIIVFVIGYLLITGEHFLRINKTATALLTAVVLWAIFMIAGPRAGDDQSIRYYNFQRELAQTEDAEPLSADAVHQGYVVAELSRHLGSIAEILFFLLGAMTIVELIDAHHGFRFVTERIQTRNPKKLLWIVCWITFFLSALLDNLTTTIVMISLIRKLIPSRDMRLLFAGMVVVAANAGGVWTPIGDVTTTMLWIGGQITTFNIMKALFLPGVVCMLAPLIILTFTMRGDPGVAAPHHLRQHDAMVGSGKLMLSLGVAVMLGVPLFKVITGLPPYVGMLAGLGILWVISELIHPELDEAVKKNYTAAGALSRIDVPSILFFLGILLSVGALESLTLLDQLSAYLTENIGSQSLIITSIGALSAIIDNVPLVAATMGMYSMDSYPTDHFVWEYLAYCAGAGGSMLVIGSAAGVAAMGMEKMDFVWYLKKISPLALAGYVAGAIVYLLMNR